MAFSGIKLDGPDAIEDDDENFNHQRDLRDAGLAILIHGSGKETPEIVSSYALIRVSL